MLNLIYSHMIVCIRAHVSEGFVRVHVPFAYVYVSACAACVACGCYRDCLCATCCLITKTFLGIDYSIQHKLANKQHILHRCQRIRISEMRS